MKVDGLFDSKLLRFGVSLAAVLLATVGLMTMAGHVNLITVSLTLLLVVLTTATFFGRNPALLASFVAMLCFNYYFIPPVGTWHISESQNLVAWAAFTLTAIIAGELSAYARRRAREAERLYEELQRAFQDATEAAALKQSEKLKSALLDAVTHDLRTPLTSIKASVTTLLDSEGGHRTIELSSEGRAEFLDIINEETDRLNGFIESMVQLARVEAGASGTPVAFANVEEIITIALERAEMIAAGHHLTVNVEKELPMIRVNARAIAEVVYNLIENAAKYSQPETTITITAVQQGNSVLVSVADEGIGIPPEMREKVLEKFVRLDSGHSDGLGLGLAIARGIVEAQNGKIKIDSGENEIGTKVTLWLPIGEE
ncbi:MAG: PAS domain-containing sensor histidine kinase [Pyrinomonadaceae bacterium]|nr:PAS domain-containing sensor histidine kinase [Pyrinomonadaceae bacterium]MBP6214190.1 PAS domain-containing sensor histidine kinase [Pyrinomonadaceae bacterium]